MDIEHGAGFGEGHHAQRARRPHRCLTETCASRNILLVSDSAIDVPLDAQEILKQRLIGIPAIPGTAILGIIVATWAVSNLTTPLSEGAAFSHAIVQGGASCDGNPTEIMQFVDYSILESHFIPVPLPYEIWQIGEALSTLGCNHRYDYKLGIPELLARGIRYCGFDCMLSVPVNLSRERFCNGIPS